MNFQGIDEKEHLLEERFGTQEKNTQTKKNYNGRSVTNQAPDPKDKRRSGSSLVRSVEGWLADKKDNMVLPRRNSTSNKPVTMQDDLKG